MPAIITQDLRIKNADTFAADLVNTPNYIYIGKSTEWADELIPDAMVGSDNDLFQVYNDLLAMKKIDSSSVLSVCRRINWVAQTVYDEYDHRVNMDARDMLGNNIYNYYVLTEEFNVYKCLSNNNGVPSTERPTSQQINAFQTSDGYIWKYMYTIRSGDVLNFLTTGWMPIYSLKYNDGSAQWQVQTTAIDGAIHRVELTNNGSNYSASNPPTVTITGDGTGATATAVVSDSGTITRIVMVSVGSGYSYATVTFGNVDDGIGAVADAILSPIGGHGFDARTELSGTAKMVKVSITGAEGGAFPTTSFRKIGIISAPLSNNLGSKVSLNNIVGYSAGDSLQGGTTGAIGQVLYVDQTVIWIQNVTGNFVVGEALNNLTTNKSSNITTVLNGIKIPLLKSVASKAEIVNRSGKILYMSNREKITRATEQSEDLRIIQEF